VLGDIADRNEGLTGSSTMNLNYRLIARDGRVVWIRDDEVVVGDAEGRPVANAVAAGKRPRSSMTPLILLSRDGRFAGAFGSAGGNAILAYVAKTMVAAVDWKLPVQQAVAAPNLVARGSNFQGELTKFSPEVLAGLRARGIDLKPGQGEDSGVHAVMIRDGRVDGGYDPRREGVVLTLPR